jgi:NAD(P)-dependent dehydrogenase (short-subunit alcohol dehydrogenase family)
MAKTLAAKGHRVFATMRGVAGRNAAAAEALTSFARDHACQIEVVELDVTDTTSVQAAIGEIHSRAARIDVVVNNAGVAASGPLEAFDVEQMQDLFNVNVFGPMRVAKAVLPRMRQRHSGLLIHVSSTLGRILPGSGGLYPASKWAVEGLAESLHYQLKPFGVDLVILEPGSFPTPALSKSMAARDEAITKDYAAMSGPRLRASEVPPDHVPPDPQEIADAVLTLVESPPGARPLRMVVGPVFTHGVSEFNAAYERARDELAASLLRPDQVISWGR